MDREAAIKATKNGAIAACISASFTLLIVTIAIMSDASGKLALWNDPFSFIDVGLIALCAFGMYKQSRVAAVFLFVYFIGAKIIISMETQQFSGAAVALIFLYYYAKAIQGAFVYHRIEKQENPEYKAVTNWWLFLGTPAAVIVLILLVFAVMSTTGVVPSTRVMSQQEMLQKDVDMLYAEGVVGGDENVLYFYSQGVTSIMQSGNVLTQERVILYLTDENNELQVYALGLNEVTHVTQEIKGSTFEDSVYLVSTQDPDRWLKLFLSTEQKGDQAFVDELVRLTSAELK